MERFIEGRNNVLSIAFANLKSSMERFIASDVSSGNTSCKIFKIQYGEIYRYKSKTNRVKNFLFKIQYGEIYRSNGTNLSYGQYNLKSSMERFIAYRACMCVRNLFYLKSSMERFIALQTFAVLVANFI